MTILPAGTFRVADYRKAIPLAVKLAVVIRQKAADEFGVAFTDADVGKIQFDHDPALTNRPYDTKAGDFIPPQHDPESIVAKREGRHLEKTTGRKEGAERTVTTRGSDIGERARIRKIQNTAKVHNFKMAAKIHGERAAARLYPEVERLQRRQQFKRKMRSRGFDKGKRPMRSRNNLRRTKS